MTTSFDSRIAFGFGVGSGDGTGTGTGEAGVPAAHLRQSGNNNLGLFIGLEHESAGVDWALQAILRTPISSTLPKASFASTAVGGRLELSLPERFIRPSTVISGGAADNRWQFRLTRGQEEVIGVVAAKSFIEIYTNTAKTQGFRVLWSPEGAYANGRTFRFRRVSVQIGTGFTESGNNLFLDVAPSATVLGAITSIGLAGVTGLETEYIGDESTVRSTVIGSSGSITMSTLAGSTISSTSLFTLTFAGGADAVTAMARTPLSFNIDSNNRRVVLVAANTDTLSDIQTAIQALTYPRNISNDLLTLYEDVEDGLTGSWGEAGLVNIVGSGSETLSDMATLNVGEHTHDTFSTGIDQAPLDSAVDVDNKTVSITYHSSDGLQTLSTYLDEREFDDEDARLLVTAIHGTDLSSDVETSPFDNRPFIEYYSQGSVPRSTGGSSSGGSSGPSSTSLSAHEDNANAHRTISEIATALDTLIGNANWRSQISGADLVSAIDSATGSTTWRTAHTARRTATEVVNLLDGHFGSTDWRSSSGITIDQARDAAGELLATLSQFTYNSGTNSLVLTLPKATNTNIDAVGATDLDLDSIQLSQQAALDDDNFLTTRKGVRLLQRIVKTASSTLRGVVVLARNQDVDATETDTSRIPTVSLVKRLIDRLRPANRQMPAGGTTGQVLKKSSSSDYDADWDTDLMGSGGGGITLEQATDAAGGLLNSLDEFTYDDSTNNLTFNVEPGRYTRIEVPTAATGMSLRTEGTSGALSSIPETGALSGTDYQFDYQHLHGKRFVIATAGANNFNLMIGEQQRISTSTRDSLLGVSFFLQNDRASGDITVNVDTSRASIFPTDAQGGRTIKPGHSALLSLDFDAGGAGTTDDRYRVTALVWKTVTNAEIDARIATWARFNNPTGTIPDNRIAAGIARLTAVQTLLSNHEGTPHGYTLTDDAVLDLAATTRTSGDRFRAIGSAIGNQNVIDFLTLYAMGPWTNIPSTMAIPAGAVVEHNNNYYGCHTALGARGSTGPNGDSAHWVLLSGFSGTWADGLYLAGTFVIRNNKPYVAQQNVALGDPAPDAGNNLKWLLLGLPDTLSDSVIPSGIARDDEVAAAYAALAGATFTGAVSGITPSAAAHFATKSYVDGALAGRESARASFIDLGQADFFYFNRTGGGASTSDGTNIGGVSINSGDSIYGESYLAADNKVYVWDVPSGGATCILADLNTVNNQADSEAIDGSEFRIVNSGSGNITFSTGGIARVFPSASATIPSGTLAYLAIQATGDLTDASRNPAFQLIVQPFGGLTTAAINALIAGAAIADSQIAATIARDSEVANLYAALNGAVFTGAVSGVTPSDDAHLTRKDYVDAQIQSVTPGAGNHTRYAALKTTNNFVTADFTAAGTSAMSPTDSITVPAYNANRYLAFAIPDTQADLTDIREQGSDFSSFSFFERVSGTIQISGSAHKVWRSTDVLLPRTSQQVWTLR